MALPKAVLCQATAGGGDEEEKLRSVGFATASLQWSEFDSHQNGWIQLLPVLEDPSVAAWVIAGKPEDFTPAIRSQIALLALAIRREKPLQIAWRLKTTGEFMDVPPALAHVTVFQPEAPFAAKLMALRTKAQPVPALPLLFKPHLDPLLGVWLELAPLPGQSRENFMAGIFGAEVTAFGVGPSGAVPEKASLHYPQLGIKGDIGGKNFCACAAKNTLGPDVSCYMRIAGNPEGVFLTDYPGEEEEGENALLAFELV